MNPCSLTGHCLRGGLSLIFYIPLLHYNLIQQPIIQQFTDARQINCCCTPHFIWMLKMARNINWATPALLLFGVEMRNYLVSWNWASQTSSTTPPNDNIYRMVIVEGRCTKLQLLISYIYNHWLTQKYSEFWLVRYNAGYCCYFLLPSYIYDHWWLQTLGLIDSSPSNRCEHNFSVKMIILEFRTC